MREVRAYHPNGCLSKIYSVDQLNRKQGLYKEYWSDGVLLRMTFYKDDMLEHNTFFYGRPKND